MSQLPARPRVPVERIALLAAPALRLAWALVVLLRRGEAGFLDADSADYLGIAGNLLHGNGYSLDTAPPYAPDSSRTPLYPLLLVPLVATGHGPLLAALLQALLGGVLAWTTVRVAARLGADRRGQALAAVLVVADVPSWCFSSLVMTETLFTTLLLGAAVLVLDPRCRDRVPAAAWAGAAVGLSILARPISVLLPLPVAVAVAWRARPGRRVLLAGTFLASAGLVAGSWVVRNHVVFGRPFLTTVGDKSLLHYRAASVLADAEGLSLEEAQARVHQRARASWDGDPAASPADFRAHEGRTGVAIMREHPASTLRVHLGSLPAVLFKPLRSNLDLQLGLADAPTILLQGGQGATAALPGQALALTSPFTLFLVVVQGLLVLGMWLGVVRGAWTSRGGPAREDVLLLLGFLAYLVVMSTEPQTYARFRVPMVPLAAAVAALALRGRGDGSARA